MIERNLQYVSLRKHGTAFLDAFGFYPLDYFGAIGDNMTDNYANIQVAINESIKRGLNYIFVPNGTYLYKGNFVDVDKITFIGNSKYAKIYDGEKEIPIYQIGCQMPFIKGEYTVSKNVEEDGYIDIPLPIKNAVEAILAINDSVVYVTDSLITVNGSFMNDLYLNTLDTDVKVTNIELIDEAVRISYMLEESSATIDTTIEWRVR